MTPQRRFTSCVYQPFSQVNVSRVKVNENNNESTFGVIRFVMDALPFSAKK